MRAPMSGIRLTKKDAALVKGMLDRGDRQHDIAAWFGVNGGRIAEISSGYTFEEVPPQHDNLPPSGPYTSGRAVHQAKQRLADIKIRLQGLIEEVDQQVKNLE